jgi:branched-chain amino acid transport system ATP-binding protein
MPPYSRPIWVRWMLQVDELRAAPGGQPVLRGVSLRIAPGEIVALLGRNGSGRSTLLKALIGLVASEGAIEWEGCRIEGLAPHHIARLGVGYLPETRDVFSRLSVQQNLALGLRTADRRLRDAAFDRAWRMFPALHERRAVAAGRLSGGEQQMLALGRTLLAQPRLLLLDEPTEGLAPALVAQVAQVLRACKADGAAVLLVEQRSAMALAVADRCAVIGAGRIVFEGTADTLQGNAYIRKEWLEA